MQGLEAIAAHNGWAMAVTGACIVMIGLTTLSIIIAQLHKVVRMIEKKEAPSEETAQPTIAEVALPSQVALPDVLSDLEAAAIRFQPMTANLGESFALIHFYRLLEAEKDPHPHITVRELREAGFLVPSGEGTFSWSKI